MRRLQERELERGARRAPERSRRTTAKTLRLPPRRGVEKNVSLSVWCRSRAQAILLFACALVGAAQRLAILCHDPQWLLTRNGSDDLFYCTEVARHIRTGDGLSFDALHSTSGVQPLWVACLTPWAGLFDGHAGVALRVDLALVTVLTLISGFLMPSLVRSVMADSERRGALPEAQAGTRGTLAGCVWLVHPRILGVTFEGTEGALAALCWQLSIMAWSTARVSGLHWGLAISRPRAALGRCRCES